MELINSKKLWKQIHQYIGPHLIFLVKSDIGDKRYYKKTGIDNLQIFKLNKGSGARTCEVIKTKNHSD